MAPRPMSMTGWRDILLPAVFQRVREYPDLSSDIYLDFARDCVCIIVMNDRTREKYEGLLLSRQEIENNTWDSVVGVRLNEAIAYVLHIAPDTQEYDDILEGQAIMDDLKT